MTKPINMTPEQEVAWKAKKAAERKAKRDAPKENRNRALLRMADGTVPQMSTMKKYDIEPELANKILNREVFISTSDQVARVAPRKPKETSSKTTASTSKPAGKSTSTVSTQTETYEPEVTSNVSSKIVTVQAYFEYLPSKVGKGQLSKYKSTLKNILLPAVGWKGDLQDDLVKLLKGNHKIIEETIKNAKYKSGNELKDYGLSAKKQMVQAIGTGLSRPNPFEPLVDGLGAESVRMYGGIHEVFKADEKVEQVSSKSRNKEEVENTPWGVILDKHAKNMKDKNVSQEDKLISMLMSSKWGPPRSDAIRGLKVVGSEDDTNKTDNFYIRKTGTILSNRHKTGTRITADGTVRSQGKPVEIILDKKDSAALNKYITTNKVDVLFPNATDTRIQTILGVSPKTLRRSFATWADKQKFDVEQRVRIAKQMAHSMTTGKTIYAMVAGGE